ncbi:SIR2-like domain-containing protein [Modestobacter sp. DSM 44400]|uniref:SIR2 family NAD-dependent protein deacylase n=1 Tax=Modestobacter sp. DSM 44400 TaxID=1550230 RepID=UPI000899E873|nr:SIR2 family protein [Modestobacter sp. DSM 44400]SDY92243.1 SIR2-like domain-containing protein [Modestobacter sp. DSM 44400]
MKLADLVALINPSQTSLLLGAGASVSSGAPTGASLARQLASRLSPPPDGGDLSEICGIYENRLGRKDLVQDIRQRLSGLQPTQGMLAVPAFNWRAIYSTNFDRLVEQAYRQAGKDLKVVRSNYEFTVEAAATPVTVLYKMHGCLTQDAADGSHSRMLLTEADYDSFVEYRQSLFDSLRINMLTGDTLIVGQSLRDAHLRSLAKDVAALRTQGVPGRVFLLAYEYDEDRAQLYVQRGIQVAGGSLEDLTHALLEKDSSRGRVLHSTTSDSPDALPPSLATTTIDISRHLARGDALAQLDSPLQRIASIVC